MNNNYENKEKTKEELVDNNKENNEIEVVESNNNQPNKKNSKNIIFIIIGLVLVVAIVSILLINNRDKVKKQEAKEKEETKEEIIEDENNDEDEETIIKDTTEKVTKKLYIVKENETDSDDDFYYLNVQETSNLEQEEGYKKEIIGTYNCKNENCKDLGVHSNYNNVVTIYDGEVIVYNFKSNKKYNTGIKLTLDEEGSYDEVILLAETEKRIYGLLFSEDVEDEKSKFYIFENGKFSFKFEKDNLSMADPYLSKGYLNYFKTNDEETKCTSSLININDGKEYLKVNNKNYHLDYTTNIPMIADGCSYDSKINLLDDNFKPILDKYYEQFENVDDNIYLYDEKGKEYSIYNTKTKSVTNKKTDYGVLSFSKDYILVEKDGNFALTDYNNKVVKEFGSTKNTSLTPFFNYYDEHDDKPAGIYFGVQDETKDDYCYEYYYNPKTGESKKFNIECGGYAKPVLYLYPTKTTEVTVNFEKENLLTTTYPKFDKEWKVTAHKNGDLYDKKGNYYYALYWEEEKNHTVDFSEGFYVTEDNAITFLEEKLTYIGLNAKERNEFIMYWLPILENNKKSLVYFELTEERDSYNKIKISPKPDSMLRIAIHIKKVDKKINIKEQKLTKFNRSGFTAVEWGGVKY
ncbi:MAG: hypothetical protein E7157_03105 [Lactobacillales bacterium]|nr:hypothetical protein [Lactobacillales bacterium]